MYEMRYFCFFFISVSNRLFFRECAQGWGQQASWNMENLRMEQHCDHLIWTEVAIMGAKLAQFLVLFLSTAI